MPRVTYNRMSKKRASTRKRRTGVLTKAKYAPATTRVNRTLIKSNAYAIRAVRRLIPPSVYTDWQYSGALLADTTGSPADTSSIVSAQLMTPSFWFSVLRKDPTVNIASSTLIKRMQLNLRCSLQQANYAQITVFVVTLRKNASNRDPISLSEGDDYIYSAPDSMNPRLNSSVFKVWYTRDMTFTSNGLFQAAPEVGGIPLSTSPGMTFSKGQINLNLNYRLRQPLGTTWRDMRISQFRPEQRLYLLAFITQQSPSEVSNPPEISFDVLYTAFNSA